MKKTILTILLILTILSIFPTITAFARTTESTRYMTPEEVPEEQNEAAIKLRKLGLFQAVTNNEDGTPNFALNYYTTRIEGIKILIRMTGNEDKAKNSNAYSPFEDVRNADIPYTAYAYINDYIHGVQRNTLQPNEKLTADMFLTTALSVLGYDCRTDFNWCTSWYKTDDIFLTNQEFNEENINISRGEIAEILLRMLVTLPKDEELLFVDKLIENNIFESLVNQQLVMSKKLHDAVKAGSKDEIKEVVYQIINGTDCDYTHCCCPICCEPEYRKTIKKEKTTTPGDNSTQNNESTGNNNQTDNRNPANTNNPPEDKNTDDKDKTEKCNECKKDPKDCNCKDTDCCKDGNCEKCKTEEKSCNCEEECCKDSDCCCEEENCKDCINKEKNCDCEEDCCCDKDCCCNEDCDTCTKDENCDCDCADNCCKKQKNNCDSEDGCNDPNCPNCNPENNCESEDGCGDPNCPNCNPKNDCDSEDGCDDPNCPNCNPDNECDSEDGCNDPNCPNCNPDNECDSEEGCNDPNCPNCNPKNDCDSEDSCGDPNCPNCKPDNDCESDGGCDNPDCDNCNPPKSDCDSNGGCDNPDCDNCNPPTSDCDTEDGCDDPSCPNCIDKRKRTYPISLLKVTNEGINTTFDSSSEWVKIWEFKGFSAEDEDTGYEDAIKTDSCYMMLQTRRVYEFDTENLYKNLAFTAYNKSPYTTRLQIFDYETEYLLWSAMLEPGESIVVSDIDISKTMLIEFIAELVNAPSSATYYENPIYLCDPRVDIQPEPDDSYPNIDGAYSLLAVTNTGTKTTSGNLTRWVKVINKDEFPNTSYTEAIKTDAMYMRQTTRTVYEFNNQKGFKTISFTAYNTSVYTAYVRMFDYETGQEVWNTTLPAGTSLECNDINITGVRKIEISATLTNAPTVLAYYYNAVYLCNPLVSGIPDDCEIPSGCGDEDCPICGEEKCSNCNGKDFCDHCGKCENCEICGHCLDCGGELCGYCGNCEDCKTCEHCIDCNGELCEHCGECFDCGANKCQECCKHEWGGWYTLDDVASRDCNKCGKSDSHVHDFTITDSYLRYWVTREINSFPPEIDWKMDTPTLPENHPLYGFNVWEDNPIQNPEYSVHADIYFCYLCMDYVYNLNGAETHTLIFAKHRLHNNTWLSIPKNYDELILLMEEAIATFGNPEYCNQWDHEDYGWCMNCYDSDQIIIGECYLYACNDCNFGVYNTLFVKMIVVTEWYEDSEREGVSMCRSDIICNKPFYGVGSPTGYCETVLFTKIKAHNFIERFCEDCGARELCLVCGGEFCEFCDNCKGCETCIHCLECNGAFCIDCGECIDCNVNPCQRCCKHTWGDWSEYVQYSLVHTRKRDCTKCNATNYDAVGHSTSTWMTSWTWSEWQWRRIELINQIPELQEVELKEESCQFRYKICVVCDYIDYEIEEHSYGSDWDKSDTLYIWNEETQKQEPIFVEPYYIFTLFLDPETNDYPACTRYKTCTNRAGGWFCPRILDEPIPHEFTLYYDCEKWIIMKGEKRNHSFSNPNDGEYIRRLSEIGNYDDIVTWFDKPMTYIYCYYGWCSRCTTIKNPTSIRPEFEGWHEWEGMCRRTVTCIHDRGWNAFDLVYIDLDPCNTILYEETKPHSIVGHFCEDCGYKIPTITVEFRDYNGDLLKSEEVADGEFATPPELPEHEGRVFKEWDGDYTNVTKPTVITAVYEIIITQTFKDPVFLADVRRIVGKETGEIYLSDVMDIIGYTHNPNGIKDFAGIENFVNLTHLLYSSSGGTLENLDVTQNLNLEYIHVSGQKISSLDLSQNSKLYHVYIGECTMTSLILPVESFVSYLGVWRNPIETLDLSTQIHLSTVSIGASGITELDFSNSKRLYALYLDSGNLSTLILPDSDVLDTVSVWENKVTTIDVSKAINLRNLSVIRNNLTALDVTNNTKLEYLGVVSNKLSELDVTNNKELEVLYTADNPIHTLDVSQNTKLINLYVGNDNLSELDITNNLELRSIMCEFNMVRELDFTGQTNLESIHLTRIHVSDEVFANNPGLRYVQINQVKYETIDFSNNPLITSLVLTGTDVMSLDLTMLNDLSSLTIQNNQLTSLDLSNNLKLSYLRINGNKFLLQNAVTLPDGVEWGGNIRFN